MRQKEMVMRFRNFVVDQAYQIHVVSFQRLNAFFVVSRPRIRCPPACGSLLRAPGDLGCGKSAEEGLCRRYTGIAVYGDAMNCLDQKAAFIVYT